MLKFNRTSSPFRTFRCVHFPSRARVTLSAESHILLHQGCNCVRYSGKNGAAFFPSFPHSFFSFSCSVRSDVRTADIISFVRFSDERCRFHKAAVATGYAGNWWFIQPTLHRMCCPLQLRDSGAVWAMYSVPSSYASLRLCKPARLVCTVNV